MVLKNISWEEYGGKACLTGRNYKNFEWLIFETTRWVGSATHYMDSIEKQSK